jgi:hypothetical protein
LSMLLFHRGVVDARISFVFAAGVCSGIATIFKPPGAAPFLAQTAFIGLWLLRGGPGSRFLLKSVPAIIGGLVLAWLPVLAYFWQYEAVADLLDAAFLYNLRYGAESHGNPLWVVLNTLPILTPLRSLIVCAVILGLCLGGGFVKRGEASKAGVRPDPQAFAVLVLMWIFFDLVGALAGGRNYPHYFLALGPSLSVAAGLVCWFSLWETTQGVKSGLIQSSLFALVLGPLVLEQASDLLKARSLAVSGPVRHDDREIAEIIKSKALTGDTVFVWNYRPSIYLRAGVNPPGRFLSAHYLRDHRRARDAIGGEILAFLEHRTPAFIVDSTRNPDKQAAQDIHYSMFRELVRHHYDLIHVTSREGLRLFEIHRYRPRGVAAE